MLSCREVSRHASSWLDGTLPGRVRLQVRLHLMMCRLCREYVRQMGLVVGVLRRFSRVEPPVGPDPALLKIFRGEP